MRKIHLSAKRNSTLAGRRSYTSAPWGTMLLLMVAGLLTASCAQDGFDDEEFVGTYTGFQLESPDASTITVKASSDRTSQTITWSAVNGAGGYQVSVYEGEDRENVVVSDTVVITNYISVPRIDKTYYYMTVRTTDNVPEQNTGATTATEFDWSTFTIEVATIPAGTDIYTFFKENPVPTEYKGVDITYRLESGGEYTLSDNVDFTVYPVTIRPTIDGQPATVTMTGEDAGFTTGTAFNLWYLDFDCSGSASPFLALTKNPDPSIVGKTGSGDYYNLMDGAIYLNHCTIRNLAEKLFYDNNVSSIKWCVQTMTVENCLVHFNIPTQTANHAYIYLPYGFIKDLYITNCTMYNTGDGNLQYFVRYSNAGRIDRAGYDREVESQSTNYVNNTFYHLGYGWWANYNAFAGQPYTHFVTENNIFYECGLGGSGIARRILGGRSASSYTVCNFLNNTYWTREAPEAEGAPGTESTSTYDLSGTALQTDPAFVDPANGNFTPTGAEQVANKTGDPRWY